MGIYLKRYTQDKPPLGSQIDWSHPLSKGLVGCWLMNEGGGVIHNLIDNTSSTTAPTWIITKKGLTLQNTNLSLGTNNRFKIVGNKATVVAGIAHGGTNVSVFGTSDLQFGPIDGSAQTKMTKSGVVDIYINSTFPNDGLYHIVAGTWGSLGEVIYVDGIQKGTAANTQNFRTSASVSATLGGANAINHFFVYFYNNRTLSPQEIQQLYQDPYQFIKPPKNRIYSYLTPAVVTGQPRSYGYLF